MIITDLPCLRIISDQDRILGGQQNNSYDNRAVSIARAYAEGPKSYAVTGTSVYLDRGVSIAQGFAVAKAWE